MALSLRQMQKELAHLHIGPLAIRWYGLMYLIGFAAAWWLGRYRARRADSIISPQQMDDLLFYAALGVILGGRIGYILFYNTDRWLSDPLQILRVWEGGMSFHGGFLGVLIQDVDRNVAESFGLDQPHGALVSRVMPDSPAEKAGLRVGDVILAFNGTKLLNSSQLPPLVGTTRIDEKATLRVLRDGKRRNIDVFVGRLPDDEPEAREIPAKAEPAQIEQLGLAVIDIEPEVREELGLEESGGALISDISPGAAQDAGIRRGDIVLMFDGVEVKNAEHLRELIEAAEEKRTVAVLVRRGDNPLFMALRLPG